MSKRTHVGEVSAYHAETGQVDVRADRELREHEHLVIESGDRSWDLGLVHISGTDTVHAGEQVAFEVPEAIPENAEVLRLTEDT